MTARADLTTEPTSLGDYPAWASRFLETCRQRQWSLREGLDHIPEYAERVREECAQEAGRWGADRNVIREQSALAEETIAHWRSEAKQRFGSGYSLDDPRLHEFLVQVFRDVRANQIRAAVREASHQMSQAYQREDTEQLNRWRYAEAALEAMLAEAGLDPDSARAEWVEAVSEFADQVAGWARERNWRVDYKPLERSEELLGSYEVPMLIIQTERGAVILEPIARLVAAAEGRIDLYAYPAGFRLMLLRPSADGSWRIRTDSRVFLPQPWSKETFFELVRDLTAA